MALLCYQYGGGIATVQSQFLRMVPKGNLQSGTMHDVKCRFGPAIAVIEHLRKRPKT